MTTKYDLLHDDILETIKKYNPEYVELSTDGKWLIEDLIDSVETFEKECNEDDPQRETLDEIVRQNCKGLSFGQNI